MHGGGRLRSIVSRFPCTVVHVSAKATTELIEALFARVDFAPNEHQRHAIEHLDGPLFLVAGPGSGKTRVLLWRVVNMIVFHGVAPESIFLSTFTEKAAKQLQDGLVSLLGLASEQTGNRTVRSWLGASAPRHPPCSTNWTSTSR